MDANRAQVERLYASRVAQRRLVRALQDADASLSKQLAERLAADPTRTDWTTGDVEATLAMVRHELVGVQASLSKELSANSAVAMSHGAKETTRILEHFEGLQPGSLRPLSLRAAAALASGTIAMEHERSVARYGAQVIFSIQRELTAGVLVNRTFSEMTAQLQKSQPLLSRRYVAERMVRTECMGSYNEGHLQEMHAQRHESFPDLLKKCIETFDKRTAQDSYVAHGEVRRLEEMFVDGKGRRYLRPPGRPNDRGVCIPWRNAWEHTEEAQTTPEIAPVTPPKPILVVPPVIKPKPIVSIIPVVPPKPIQTPKPISVIPPVVHVPPKPVPVAPPNPVIPPIPVSIPKPVIPAAVEVPKLAVVAQVAPKPVMIPAPAMDVTGIGGGKIIGPSTNLNLVTTSGEITGIKSRAMKAISSAPDIPGHADIVSPDIGSSGFKIASTSDRDAEKRCHSLIAEIGKTAEELSIPVRLTSIENATVNVTAGGISRNLLIEAASIDLTKSNPPVVIRLTNGQHIPADDRSHVILLAQALKDTGSGLLDVKVIHEQGLIAYKAMSAPPIRDQKELGARLSSSLASGNNSGIREAFRSWHNGDGDPKSFDVLEFRRYAGEFNFVHRDKLPPGAEAVHGWDGEMVSEESYRHSLGKIAAELESGKKLSNQSKTVLGMFLHEESHGYSPITVTAYQGGGVVLEEVGTELLARRATRRLNLQKDGASAPSFQQNGIIDQGDGAYGGFMIQMLKALKNAGVPEQGMSTRIENAFLKLRHEARVPPISTPEEYASVISNYLGDDLPKHVRDAAKISMDRMSKPDKK